MGVANHLFSYMVATINTESFGGAVGPRRKGKSRVAVMMSLKRLLWSGYE
jgi:hypothetical protein